jgi:hypothetical protein
MKFLDDMYGPDVLRTLKKIERKRHDVRRRLINEQVCMVMVVLFFFLQDNTQIHIAYIYMYMSLFNL